MTIAQPLRALLLGLTVLSVAGVSACSSKVKLREPAKLKDIESPRLKLASAWTHSIGAGANGRPSGLRPLLEADALYAANVDGEVYALDPVSGKELWRAKTKARVISGPSVVGDLVLVGTLDAEVIALKRADGSPRWRGAASSEVLAPPAGDGEVVVVRSIDGRAYGLSVADGKRLWSFDRTEPNLTLRGLSAPLVDGNRVLLGMDNGRLVAVRLNDGQPIWEQPVSTPSGRTELERLTDIDAALVPTQDGVLVASYGGDVSLIEPGDGESRWRRAIKSHAGVAIGAGNAYVSDADGIVWGLDLASGAAAWKNDSLQYRRLSPPAFFAGHVVVADFEGYVHFLDPKDGSLVARTRAGSDPVLAPPVASEDRLYLQSVDGRLSALTAKPR
ncbi:MAG: outer membrane protein assembly factor BamB [Stagnimonas sp.]|nr:outer membrane protein assembly factor BamB [Stagnimonas sp.]